MTISNFRATEALYIVIVRNRDAEHHLREWARANNSQVTIENNRMKIFEDRSLNLFTLTWQHDWANVIIWDTWNKRHIDLD
jgi:hypothetical protein